MLMVEKWSLREGFKKKIVENLNANQNGGKSIKLLKKNFHRTSLMIAYMEIHDYSRPNPHDCLYGDSWFLSTQSHDCLHGNS